MTDTELLAAYCREGSQAAFALLVQRHVDMVYGAALRQVRTRAGDLALADDVTQAVFIVLMRRAKTIRDGRLLAAWLLNAARFCVRDALKAERRRKRRELAVAGVVGGAAAGGQMGDMVAKAALEEMTWVLDEGLAGLSAVDREAVILRYWREMPLVEVGASLGVSEEAAKKRVGRAVEKLRKFFVGRGMTGGAAAVAGVLGETARASAPVGVKAACAALGKGAVGVSAGAGGAAAIAKGALWIMNMSKLVMATVCVGVVVTGGAVAVKVYEVARGPEASQIERPALEIVGTPYAGPEAQFYVVGNVARPASYRLQGEMTLTQALTLAGLSADAADSAGKRIEIIRWAGEKDETIARMMAADLFTGKEADRFLQPNDVINVGLPPAVATMPNVVGTPFGGGVAEVYVMGRVSRAGVYRLGKEFTLKQALAYAGLGADGTDVDGQRIDLIRRVGEKGEIITRAVVVDLFTGKAADLYLQPNDVINVGIQVAATSEGKKVWYIMGAVAEAGVYAFDAGKPTTVMDALTKAQVSVPQNMGIKVEIVRRDRPDHETLLYLRLEPGLKGADGEKELMPEDVLAVTANAETTGTQPAVADATPVTTQAALADGNTIRGTPAPGVNISYQMEGNVRSHGQMETGGNSVTVLQAIAAAGIGPGMMWPTNVVVGNGRPTQVQPKDLLKGIGVDRYVQAGDNLRVEGTYSVLGVAPADGVYLLRDGMALSEALGQAQVKEAPATVTIYRDWANDAGKKEVKQLTLKPDWSGPEAQETIRVDDLIFVH